MMINALRRVVTPGKRASGNVETNCPSEEQKQKEVTKYSNYKTVGFRIEIINNPVHISA
jgi:hypothetical protein